MLYEDVGIEGWDAANCKPEFDVEFCRRSRQCALISFGDVINYYQRLARMVFHPYVNRAIDVFLQRDVNRSVGA